MASGPSDEVTGIEVSPCLQTDGARRVIRSFVLGHALALSVGAASAVGYALSVNYEVRAPTALLFVSYLLLCLVYGTWLAFRLNGHAALVSVVRTRGWRYFLAALADVEAAYMVLSVFAHTDLLTVQLLRCLAVPVALAVSWRCARVRYLLRHVLAATAVVLATVLFAFGHSPSAAGALRPRAAQGADQVVGSALCLGGVALAATQSVCQEVFVKNFGKLEYLGMVGLFGSVISGLQLALMERSALSTVRWNEPLILVLFVGFALCMFVVHSLTAAVLRRTSAAYLSLALVPVNFYALLISVYVFQYTLHGLYFAGMILSSLGCLLYLTRQTKTTDDPTNGDNDNSDMDAMDAGGAHVPLESADSAVGPAASCVCFPFENMSSDPVTSTDESATVSPTTGPSLAARQLASQQQQHHSHMHMHQLQAQHRLALEMAARQSSAAPSAAASTAVDDQLQQQALTSSGRYKVCPVHGLVPLREQHAGEQLEAEQGGGGPQRRPDEQTQTDAVVEVEPLPPPPPPLASSETMDSGGSGPVERHAFPPPPPPPRSAHTHLVHCHHHRYDEPPIESPL